MHNFTLLCFAVEKHSRCASAAQLLGAFHGMARGNTPTMEKLYVGESLCSTGQFNNSVLLFSSVEVKHLVF